MQVAVAVLIQVAMQVVIDNWFFIGGLFGLVGVILIVKRILPPHIVHLV
jgi:hypothetical protein